MSALCPLADIPPIGLRHISTQPMTGAPVIRNAPDGTYGGQNLCVTLQLNVAFVGSRHRAFIAEPLRMRDQIQVCQR